MPSKKKPQPKAKIREVGHIDSFFSGIAKLRGLPRAALHEVLVDDHGEPCALVIGFSDEFVEALFFDDTFPMNQPVFRSGRPFSIPVSDGHVGRVLDGLGRSRDELPAVVGEAKACFRPAPLAVDRDLVKRPLITGIKMIDATLPLGRGQRELIIGDRQVGKSSLAVGAVIHQKHAGPPVHCVYVLCGGPARRAQELASELNEAGAMLYSTIVAADSDASFAEQYLAPFVGCTIAEHWRDTGRDALVIYDDLSKHAKTCRDVSLLLERSPGRETYPADIFSIHAGLLERAAQLSAERGGGSLTALPMIETQEGDLTAYVPTNLISITDGQIYLERGLKDLGYVPAINVGLSVSRLGAQVQPAPLRDVTVGLRLSLSQQKELHRLTQLETEISREAQKKIHRGNLLLELLKQDREDTVRWEEQVVLFLAVEEGHFDDLPEDQWRRLESVLRDVLRNSQEEMLGQIRAGHFDAAIKNKLREVVDDFKSEFVEG